MNHCTKLSPRALITSIGPESPDDIPLSEWEITVTNIPDMEPPACKKRRKSRQKKKSYYHN